MKGMKVVAVLGSPRQDSNSQKLAEAAISALPPEGLEVKKARLSAMDYKGCQACFACKGASEICVLKDDLTKVLADVAEADMVILASPIYIGEITGQMKCFIDRTFSYYLPDYTTNPKPSRLAPGKKMLFILTQGMPDAAVYEGPVLGHYTGYFQSLGFDVRHFIAPGLGGDDIEKTNPDKLKAVAEMAAGM